MVVLPAPVGPTIATIWPGLALYLLVHRQAVSLRWLLVAVGAGLLMVVNIIAFNVIHATLVVAAKAVRDAEASWVQAVLSGVTPAGLFGGSLVVSQSGAAFTLKAYSIVPGVRLGGKLSVAGPGFPIGFKGTLRVSGPKAAAGTIHVSRHSLSGLLGGRRVRSSF